MKTGWQKQGHAGHDVPRTYRLKVRLIDLRKRKKKRAKIEKIGKTKKMKGKRRKREEIKENRERKRKEKKEKESYDFENSFENNLARLSSVDI